MLCENTCCYTNIACLLISRHMQHNASTGKARLCNIILITVVETGEAEVASFLGPAQLFSRLPGNEAISEVYVCHSLK